MTGQGVRHRSRVRVPEVCGADDVGEHEGDDARWACSDSNPRYLPVPLGTETYDALILRFTP